MTDVGEIFRTEFGEARHAFWVDGPTTLLGSADAVATFRVGDGVRIDGELVEPDLWTWLNSLADTGQTWVGYLGYGVKALTRGGAQHPQAGIVSHGLPDAVWLRADRIIEIPRDRSGFRYAASGGYGSTVNPVTVPLDPEQVMSSRERADYVADIETIRGHLARGESYEVCLTRTLTLPSLDNPLALHQQMRSTSPTGRSVFLRTDDLAVCAATPEEFLTVTAAGVVRSRPIKGTAPRHPDPVRDAEIAASLASDPKTRAENLMIVDLVRNDLNQVCVPGSVTVPHFLAVENYRTVHQLVSTVTGRLAPAMTRVDAIRASFPPGSMTGAPKERTMQIIDALEPVPRGIYSGTIGVLYADGRADLRVVIRTAVVTPEATTVGIGGAITWLSDADAEWEETELKAAATLSAYARATALAATSADAEQ